MSGTFTRTKIRGMGRYLPPKVVPASDIEAKCGVQSGWVAKMTGVSERRWVDDETAPAMGAHAAREALDRAGIALSDVDLILNASGSVPQAIPDGGALLQRALGPVALGIPAFTIHATCLSFLVALDTASSLIAAGRYRTILIVSSEIASAGINFEEPESASLFGDLAVAAVVGPTPDDEPSTIHAARLETFGDGADLCRVAGGGTSRHPNRHEVSPKENLFHMDGPRVYRHVHKHLPAFLERLDAGLSKGLGGVSWVVPHQASILAIRSLRKFGYPQERVIVNIEKYGNTIAASIPNALYDGIEDGRIRRGDRVLLVGTGAGVSLGGVVLTF